MSTDSESYNIRSFQAMDYSKVIKLWKNSDGIGLNEADEWEALEKYLERNPEMSLVAEVGQNVVGAVLCGHDGRRGYLHHLAVVAEWQGKGIGSALVDTCIRRLKNEGIQKCHVFVFPDNLAGVKFWHGRGFIGRDDLKICSRNI